jgi:HK97 family phage prohead protease
MKVIKSIALSDASLKLKGDEGSFTGYASVFGVKDAQNDVIVAGAFADALKGDPPKMFFNHKSWEVPIGAWKSMEEDEHGLKVEGVLAPGHSEANNVYGAMKVGGLDGMSIGFFMGKDDYEMRNGVRHIKSISDLVEISVVTFPANDPSRVDIESIKSALGNIDSVQEFEAFIREELSVSKALSKALIGKFKDVCQREAGDVAKYREFVDTLKLTSI